MALEFIHSEKGMRRMSSDVVVIDRHLYLTEDKARVVEEGDSAGRWLWASPGQEVSRREAERVGAVKVPVADPEPVVAASESEPVVAEKPKARTPAGNKQRAKGEDK